jgi:alpha-ketoglutarate-dependent taurine dioxygenase
LPPYGGTTTWTSTVAAYQQLPQPLKGLAENLWAVHNNAFDYTQIDPAKLKTRLGGTGNWATSRCGTTAPPSITPSPTSTTNPGVCTGQAGRRPSGERTQ